MDEFRARRVVDALRDRGVNAHLLRGGVGQFGIRVSLTGGRDAEWDTDGTAGLEAQVMRDGMMVGFVPQIEGSEDFDESQIVDAIARTDYDQPVARQRAVAPEPGPRLPAKAASSAVSSTASATGNEALCSTSWLFPGQPSSSGTGSRSTSMTLRWSTVPGSRSGSWLAIRIEAANQRPSSPPSIVRCGGPTCSTGSRILRAASPRRTSIRSSTATSRLPGAGMPP
jgi:hypothetical protein